MIAVLSPDTPQFALIIWALLAILALADLLLTGRPRSDLTFDVPAEVFVGEAAEFTLDVTPWRRGMRSKLDWPVGLSGPVDVAFENMGDRARAVIPTRAVRRGTWEIAQIWVTWPSRFGFFDYIPRVPADLSVKIVPNIRLVQSGQITTTVTSALYGVKENRAIGDGSEFHQLQDFVQGMDVKAIDWKRSARRRALVVKELRAERNHHVIVALDNGYL
ncbi:MAG: DUF58 domain-containing protein, partial [Pseudomonadota bacterium]